MQQTKKSRKSKVKSSGARQIVVNSSVSIAGYSFVSLVQKQQSYYLTGQMDRGGVVLGRHRDGIERLHRPVLQQQPGDRLVVVACRV